MEKCTTTSEDWLAENREALESSNDFVARNGLPMALYRDHKSIDSDNQDEQPGDAENSIPV